jgi:ribonuclease G
LPWFRWKNKKNEQTAPEGATSEVPTAPGEPVAAAAAAPSPSDAHGAGSETEAQRAKRRRGSRGGRGRKRPAADGTVAAPAAPGAAPAAGTQTKDPAREKPERSQRAERNADRRRTGGQGGSGSGQRRRQPPRRAPLPAAKRELLISVDIGEQRVAVIEDDRVAEVYLERPERRSIAGNIYLGTVDNVLPGMEAAFVEIGLEKNGFLYVDEIVVPELEGKRHGKKIQDLISRGEQLLVQAVKDPMKTKGARLTTEISLPGRFLVYVPNGEGLGVSRRLEDAERARLKDIIKGLDVKEGGVIVRTAAEGASAEDVERDLVFLQRLWKTIQARAKGAAAPALVYQEAELPLRIVRDLFAGDFVSAQVDNERTHKRIVSYLKKTSPHMIERVHRYKEKEPLFETSGVEKEIASTLDRRVDLPSGGYLIFDYAEAFTVVDVNTGRFVGSRSKNSNQRLEDTITKNNLEAVKEVVRQLRLRDIGGIIVIDFIDMANPKNRASVEDALRDELERDRTKTYVVEISPLGLVEMTRQNVTDGPREILTRKCPTCAGDGIVVSDHTVAMQVERKLRALAAPGSRVQAYQVALHPRVLELVVGPGGARLAAIEETTRRRFFLVAAEGHVHTDHFSVLAEGKLADLQPAVHAAEGTTVEIKLGEVGRYDATAAAGKLDGLEIIVADAAKLVGKKATVTIGRVLDGHAFATLVSADDNGAGPITFESEAEKPTRAPAKRRASAANGPADSAGPEDGEAEQPIHGDAAVEMPSSEDAITETVGDVHDGRPDTDGDEPAPAKKRTRRGSRGGRRRRKPAGAAAGTDIRDGSDPEGDRNTEADGAALVDATEEASGDPAAEPSRAAAAVGANRRRVPRIHMPGDPTENAPSDHKADGAGGTRDAALAPNGADPDTHAGATVDQGVADDAIPIGAADGEAPPVVKRKTRRGSRGGKNHRKKAAAVEASTNADSSEPNGAVALESERREPAPEAAVAAAEPEAVATATADRVVESRSDAPDSSSGDEAGYVPMSEWLDDFDRR